MTSAGSLFDQRELAFIRERSSGTRRAAIAAEFRRRFGRKVTRQQIQDVCTGRGWRLIGSLSYLHDGSLMVWAGKSKGFQKMQRVMWEEIVGPLPDGCYVLPINGDRFDFDPFNWIMVTHAMRNRLRSMEFFSAPPELRQTILATAKLKQALQERTGVKLQGWRDRIDWRLR